MLDWDQQNIEPDGALKAEKAAVCGSLLKISHLNIRQHVCSNVLQECERGELPAALQSGGLQTLSPLWKALLFPPDEKVVNPM